jgi:cytochrome c peroxidase
VRKCDLMFSGMSRAAVLAVSLAASGIAQASGLDTPEALGKALFFDSNLSANRSESCSSCHSPDQAFTDPRETKAGEAASLGDDGTSIGDRNAPTASYARFAPAFAKGADGQWRGGLFHDGRAATLEDQAGGPPLNPAEMGMKSKGDVVARLSENPDYVTAFTAIYGAGALADAEQGYANMTKAIAAFERTTEFSPFDSRYDRALRGEIKLTEEEELGRTLFFSNQFTNCSQCHRLNAFPDGKDETFSNYTFHNIGVPENTALRALNGAKGTTDLGLYQNTAVNKDESLKGKFKVPTLRNVAVTGPYMHNGVFKDLRTVMLFYNKYNSTAPRRQIDPETGAAWAPPEVAGTLSLKELESGPALKDREIDALVAFLKALTDKRYEPLLAK